MRARLIREAIGDVLKPKSQDDIFSDLYKLSFGEYEYEVKKAFYPFDEFNVISNNIGFRRTARKMLKTGFKNKIDPHLLAKEIAKKYLNEGIKPKFICEAIENVLKSKKNIESIFRSYGINGDEISIRIRKPEMDYTQLRLDRALEYANVKAKAYHGPVPFEEHESYFLEVYGKPWNVLNFAKNYYQWGKEPSDLSINKLKTLIKNT